MDDEPVDIDDVKTQRQWLPVGLLVAATVAVGATVAFGATHHTATVIGTPVANTAAVIAAAADNRAAAEQAAAEQQRRDDETFLRNLESEVKAEMSDYFAGPAYGYPGEHVMVWEVHLVQTGPTQFEGAAQMSANGGPTKSILVHVTADDRSLLWKTDDGGLLPLFR